MSLVRVVRAIPAIDRAVNVLHFHFLLQLLFQCSRTISFQEGSFCLFIGLFLAFLFVGGLRFLLIQFALIAGLSIGAGVAVMIFLITHVFHFLSESIIT